MSSSPALTPSLSPSDSEPLDPKFTEQEQLQSGAQLEKRQQQRNKVPESLRLFLDLPDKTNEAKATYEDIDTCTYQTKALGASGSEGADMACFCTEDVDDEGVNWACTDESCINRGTKIECTTCHDCGNMRFQRRQYASVAVIQTERKGFGVRVEQDLEPDDFVWEYIGDVIDEKTFKKRMLDYDQQGIRHFYFMMLQKGEFIDATKKGSLARFCNHSCNPNCYVEKWVVGDKLKMGIFAKRRIVKGEELTFNYNVDRYGANAQPCYCGEANCIGFIGGKTQTEAASLLPQYLSTALGSTAENEQAFLHNLKDQGLEPTNVTEKYLEQLELSEVMLFEVPSVMAAVFQCEDEIVASKLLDRLEMSPQNIRQKARVHRGFESFGRLLRFSYDHTIKSRFDVSDDLIVRLLSLMYNDWETSIESLERSGIVPIVDQLAQKTESDEVRALCVDLKDKWSHFKKAFKMAKRKDNGEKAQDFILDTRRQRQRSPSASSSKPESKESKAWKADDLPLHWFAAQDPNTGNTYYFHELTKETRWDKPVLDIAARDAKIERMRREREEQRRLEQKLKLDEKKKGESKLEEIIAEINRKKQEEEDRRQLENLKLHLKMEAAKEKKKTAKKYGEEEFRIVWKKFFAKHIPNMIKKYEKELGHEKIKESAKSITSTLVDKEYKKHPDRKPPSTLEPKMEKSLRAFAKVYMDKLVEHKNKKRAQSQEESDQDRKKQHV